MTIEKDFLGRGWSFPPAFDKERKDVVMLSGKEDIDSSLHILLSTTMGERVMQPRYGCNLKQFLFDPTNSEMTAYIKKLVEDACPVFRTPYQTRAGGTVRGRRQNGDHGSVYHQGHQCTKQLCVPFLY